MKPKIQDQPKSKNTLIRSMTLMLIVLLSEPEMQQKCVWIVSKQELLVF